MAIILVPGIKGSELVDTYPIGWPTRWSLEDIVVGDVFENPLDLGLVGGRYDRADAHAIRPSRPIAFAYSDLVTSLRSWLAPEALYVYTYDWRKPIERAAQGLADFIADLQGRAQALKKSERIALISHSMGGLVVRSALGIRNARDPFGDIDRVVFIAPPFRGASDVPKVLVAGEKDGWFGATEDYRRIARTFPSVYQMTPTFDSAIVDEDGKPVDLFDARKWQANVRDGGEFDTKLLGDAEAFVRGRAARFGGSSAAPMIGDAALAAAGDKVLVLQSVGYATPMRTTVETRNERNPNWFDFAGAQSDTLGDGRVHLKSAAVKGVTLAAYSGAAEHGRVCRDSRVINTVSLWLEGKRALKMTPRTRVNSIDRPARTYFDVWNGDAATFADHIV